jgi:sugar lactone lactonase YvrE
MVSMIAERAAEPVLRAQAELGEGPVWDDAAARLRWVNILAGELHAFDPASGRDACVTVGEMIGTVAPWKAGTVVAALTERVAAVNAATGAAGTLAALEPSGGAVRFNDGKCDPTGRFWAGTLSLRGERDAGALYSLETDGRLVRRLAPVTTSNGLAWSADARTMYYIDTGTSGVDAFDFDAGTGNLSRRRRLCDFDASEGKPDGMTLDEEGMLWVAHWDGGRVTRRDPRSGRVVAVVRVPAPRVTACWFGGPDRRRLFITTARAGLDESARRAFPMSGDLFCAEPGARGVAAAAYGGQA